MIHLARPSSATLALRSWWAGGATPTSAPRASGRRKWAARPTPPMRTSGRMAPHCTWWLLVDTGISIDNFTCNCRQYFTQVLALRFAWCTLLLQMVTRRELSPAPDELPHGRPLPAPDLRGVFMGDLILQCVREDHCGMEGEGRQEGRERERERE